MCQISAGKLIFETTDLRAAAAAAEAAAGTDALVRNGMAGGGRCTLDKVVWGIGAVHHSGENFSLPVQTERSACMCIA